MWLSIRYFDSTLPFSCAHIPLKCLPFFWHWVSTVLYFFCWELSLCDCRKYYCSAIQLLSLLIAKNLYDRLINKNNPAELSCQTWHSHSHLETIDTKPLQCTAINKLERNTETSPSSSWSWSSAFWKLVEIPWQSTPTWEHFSFYAHKYKHTTYSTY